MVWRERPEHGPVSAAAPPAAYRAPFFLAPCPWDRGRWSAAPGQPRVKWSRELPSWDRGRWSAAPGQRVAGVPPSLPGAAAAITTATAGPL